MELQGAADLLHASSSAHKFIFTAFSVFFSHYAFFTNNLFLEVTSKLHSFFCMGNCIQLSFPHLQQKYLALALFSLLPWFYYLWHSTADDRSICIFKCSLPIKLTANFSLTGSLFCIRALYQQNSLPRIHSSLLQLITTYSFINLDTVTPLAHLLAKINLCILSALNFFVH